VVITCPRRSAVKETVASVGSRRREGEREPAIKEVCLGILICNQAPANVWIRRPRIDASMERDRLSTLGICLTLNGNAPTRLDDTVNTPISLPRGFPPENP
jgi:hypothetical protein